MDYNNNTKCGCGFNIKTVGNCDVSKLNIDGRNRTNLNWTEISVPEILCIPEQKPDIEAIDQVYANIVLDNIKLIETPFAYRKYTLFSFYSSVTGLGTSLSDLVTTLTDAITALIKPALDTTLIGALNTLKTALNLLVAVPGVPALIVVVSGLETTVNDLINSINTAVDAVSTAVDNLLAAIIAIPFSAEAICAAIQALIDALNASTTLINSILDTLTNMVNTLGTAATGIPLVTTAVGVATTAINLLINTTLSPLITTVTDAINAILALLLPINCQNSCAFEIIGNAEGTCLSGRKLIIEGTLKQKVVYTAEVDVQSVHSAYYEVPFIAFIIPYAKFEGLTYQQNIEVYDPITKASILINGYICNNEIGINVDLSEEFNIEKGIEDVYVYALDERKIFKNVTVFLKAKPSLGYN